MLYMASRQAGVGMYRLRLCQAPVIYLVMMLVTFAHFIIAIISGLVNKLRIMPPE